MSRQFWTETLTWTTASGTQISNTTTETIIHPNVTIPANYMQDGRAIEIFAFGMSSNVVTMPGTLTSPARPRASRTATIDQAEAWLDKYVSIVTAGTQTQPRRSRPLLVAAQNLWATRSCSSDG
jgi:hypothetical protein